MADSTNNDPQYRTPSTVPMGVYAGRVPNPHILYGQDDIETAPVTFVRIGTRWGDVQLSNGWQNTNYGKICNYRGEGYLDVVQPTIPGQTRLFGQYSGSFVPRGAAPSQWDAYFNSGPGMQPNYPGGPGQAAGIIYNPGSGG